MAKFAESKLFQDEAALNQRLLHLDKKRSQDILAGGPAPNTLRAIREADFKRNIQLFWDRVKRAKNGMHSYAAEGDTPTVTSMAKEMLRALEEKARSSKNDAGSYADALRKIKQYEALYADEVRRILDELGESGEP